MAGTSNLSGDESIVFADNASFDGTKRGGRLTTNAELWVGSTASPHVKKGTITSSTLTVGYSDPNITIEMPGGGAGVEEFNPDVGANIVPDVGGVVAVTGTSIFSSGSVANTLTLNVEATANTFLYGQGADTNVAELGPLTDGQLIIGDTGNAPVAGAITSTDGSVTVSLGAGTIDLSVAAGDDAVLTLTGDSGGALSPTAGNINILGGPGVTVTGSGSTLTVNSVVYTDQAGSTSVASDSGSFSTAAITLTLPASPAQGERCEFVASTADQLVVQAAGTQVIHIGNTASSATGTATSSAIGDSLSLVYQSSTDDWWAISVQGNWSLA